MLSTTQHNVISHICEVRQDDQGLDAGPAHQALRLSVDNSFGISCMRSNMGKSLQYTKCAHSHSAILIHKPMLLTELLHLLLNLAKVMPGQSGEQMVLYLVVQSTCTRTQLWHGAQAEGKCCSAVHAMQNAGKPPATKTSSIFHLQKLEHFIQKLSPVNQSFHSPGAMSLVETTWAVTKSFSVLYTSMPL